MTQKQYNIGITSKTHYIPKQSSPTGMRYVFAYTITITNSGLIAARLLRRHGIITDANGKVQKISGDGVIGEQPYILPHRSYQYSSASVLETPVGCMQGKYEMMADDGATFDAPISVFNLSIPNVLH